MDTLRICVSELSKRYLVRVLTEDDVPAVYELSKGNPMFYEYCPPFVTEESIRKDMKALPPRTTYFDKFYIGFFDGDRLTAVMDLEQKLSWLNECLALAEEEKRLNLKIGKIRGVILLISFAVMIICISGIGGALSAVLIGVCLLAAVSIIYKNLAILTNTAGDDSKTAPFKAATVFGVILTVASFGYIVNDEISSGVSEAGEKLFAMILTTAVILIFGLFSPKMTYNRHFGLRLPWTLDSERAWTAAHKTLGIISMPIAFLYLAAAFTVPSFEAVPVAAIMAWVLIPSIVSLIVFMSEYRGRR